jgi:hypothetical protein
MQSGRQTLAIGRDHGGPSPVNLGDFAHALGADPSKLDTSEW